MTAIPPALVEVEPAEVYDRLGRGEVVLVDVREANEIAAERIPGAISMPLSRFDPHALPAGDLVFSCLSGKRSAMAVTLARNAGLALDTHMRGGLTAWKAAGLPTER